MARGDSPERMEQRRIAKRRHYYKYRDTLLEAKQEARRKRRPAHPARDRGAFPGREQIVWLAGLVEGEGSFVRRKKTSTWLFTLEMTDRDVVEKAAGFWGYGSVRLIPARQRPHALGTKDIFVWRFQRREELLALAFALYPFLGTRRKEAVRRLIRETPAAARRDYGRFADCA